MGFGPYRSGRFKKPNKLATYKYKETLLKGSGPEKTLENFIKFANLKHSVDKRKEKKLFDANLVKYQKDEIRCIPQTQLLLECWRSNKMNESKCLNTLNDLEKCLNKRVLNLAKF